MRLVDTFGLPAAGVQGNIVFLPSSAPVTVEDLPPTDGGGYAVGYVSSSEDVCITVEIHVGGVVLLGKPYFCFSSP